MVEIKSGKEWECQGRGRAGDARERQGGKGEGVERRVRREGKEGRG